MSKEWISVEEKLPENNEIVLCLTDAPYDSLCKHIIG